MGKIIALEGLSGCGKNNLIDSIITQLRLEMSQAEHKVGVVPITFPSSRAYTGGLISKYHYTEFEPGENPDECLFALHSIYALDRYVTWNSYINEDIWHKLRMDYKDLPPLSSTYRALYTHPEYFGFDDIIIVADRFTLSSMYQIGEYLIGKSRDLISPRCIVELAIEGEERRNSNEKVYTGFNIANLGELTRTERTRSSNEIYSTAQVLISQTTMTTFLEKLSDIMNIESKSYGLPVADALNIFIDVPWDFCKQAIKEEYDQHYRVNDVTHRYMRNDTLNEFVRYLFLYLQQSSSEILGHCNIVHIVKGYNGSLQLSDNEKLEAVMKEILSQLFSD